EGIDLAEDSSRAARAARPHAARPRVPRPRGARAPAAGPPAAKPPAAGPDGARPRPAPRAALFVCGSNAIRSPMAAALLRQMLGAALRVGSAGVREGELDGFAVAAMEEIGIDIAAHRPHTLEQLEDLEEGLDYDLIITLAPEAHHRALELTHRIA